MVGVFFEFVFFFCLGLFLFNACVHFVVVFYSGFCFGLGFFFCVFFFLIYFHLVFSESSIKRELEADETKSILPWP